MTTWRVGDPVVVLADANGIGGGTFIVASVGRKWFTITQYGRSRKFSLEDGYEQGDGVGGYCLAVTPERAAYLERHAVAVERLVTLTREYGWMKALTPQECDAISDIIKNAQEQDDD